MLSMSLKPRLIATDSRIVFAPGLRSVQVHQPSSATQSANGAAAAVAGLVTPLNPVLPVLDQRSADRQHLQRHRVRLAGRDWLKCLQGKGFW